ncbi:MAG: ribonuclease III [Candidatus Omnitrophica bacterium]|nr:ribonuclease III [Candidatus Omnitrophota bacterium]
MKQTAKRKPKRPRRPSLGLTFSNPKLLEAALTHPSYRNENPLLHLDDFDRLEFFGDSILNYVICCELIEAFPKANEGILSRFRSTLVSRKILARVAGEMGLVRFLKLGHGLQEDKGLQKSKILADALEALIAALYEDQGLPAARDFILKHLAAYINPRRLLRLDPNPKSTLQELSQKKWKKVPEYSWKPVRLGIQVQVKVGRKYRVAVTGKNRRELEEKAARELLKKLRLS